MADRMNYAQAVLFHEQTKAYGDILGLNSIRALMRELGDVWKELNIVHIAGTNGKGSVCCFLASVLKEAGYLTGQYNSPAVFDLREVYQIGGQWITKEEYAACMEELAAACERMRQKGLRHPTVFEIDTALAFLWFYKRKCEIVLLETGLGGSTDATNVIEKPLCSVLTSIGMDHTAFLGDSLEKIAEVKSGIIKEGRPVVTAEQKAEADRVLFRVAEERRAPYYRAECVTESWIEDGFLCFCHPDYGIIKLSMTGNYQTGNCALAIKALQLLGELGYPVSKPHLLRGLKQAKWEGRFECLGKDPLFYIDGAHNTEAAEQLAVTLKKQYKSLRRIGIMGVMADKPYARMLEELLPLFEKIYTVTPNHKRSLPAQKLADEIIRQKKRAEAKESVALAVREAYQEAKKEGGKAMVVVFGSLYYLREVKQAFYEITGNRQENQSDSLKGGIWN